MRKNVLHYMLFTIFVVSYTIFQFRYYRNNYQEYEEMKLQRAMNAATDAAVHSMVEDKTKLNQDYQAPNKVVVDPYLALQMYAKTIALNYGMNDSLHIRQKIIQENIPAMAVCAYDGFYLGSNTLGGFQFTPKLPYSYYPNKNDKSTEQFLTFGADSVIINNMSMKKQWDYDANKNLGEGKYAHITAVVTARLAKAIDSYNEQTALIDETAANRFFVPGELNTLAGTNPIKGIGVITLVQDARFRTQQPINNISVAGTRVDSDGGYWCYIRNVGGKKIRYYSAKRDLKREDFAAQGIVLIREVATAEQAAKHGFFPDIRYLIKGGIK